MCKQVERKCYKYKKKPSYVFSPTKQDMFPVKPHPIMITDIAVMTLLLMPWVQTA